MPSIKPCVTTCQRTPNPQASWLLPGKSYTGQVWNIMQHIKDSFDKRMITGAIFVHLSAAHDTISHWRLLAKIDDMMKDYQLLWIIQSLLEKSMIWHQIMEEVEPMRKKKRNGLPQGNIIALILFNIFIDDQPIYPGIRSLIYADDLCITSPN